MADTKTDLWTDVDDYICDFFVPADEALDAALKDSEDAGLPAIAVTGNQGKMLYILAKMCQAKKILEFGTLGGYSTIWMARALPKDGRLITLEYEPKHAAVATKNIERAGLSNLVEIRVGRAIETLPEIETEKSGPFDFIFIDADKASYPEYFQWSLKLSRPGTLMIVDNVVRSGKVIDARSEEQNVQGVRRFYELASAEKRVTVTAVQTVGSKGYDGFAMVMVND